MNINLSVAIYWGTWNVVPFSNLVTSQPLPEPVAKSFTNKRLKGSSKLVHVGFIAVFSEIKEFHI